MSARKINGVRGAEAPSANVSLNTSTTQKCLELELRIRILLSMM